MPNITTTLNKNLKNPLATANGAIASGVIDPLISGLACQATGQLKILKNNLQYLWQNTNEEINNMSGTFSHVEIKLLREKIMYDKIKSCIVHHNKIIE